MENGLTSLKEKEKNSNRRKKLIQQKKLITAEEYKKKLAKLRNDVSSPKERNKLLENVSTSRSKARNELLKNLNPIIKNYMEEKK